MVSQPFGRRNRPVTASQSDASRFKATRLSRYYPTGLSCVLRRNYRDALCGNSLVVMPRNQ